VVAQARQDDWERKRGRDEAIGAAAAWLVDDDLDPGFELAPLVDELDIQGYPAANSTGAVESGADIHAYRSGRGCLLRIRCGHGRLHASQKEAGEHQNSYNAAHLSIDPSLRIDPTPWPPAVADPTGGWEPV
jgi:hypothetical protein